MPPQTLDSEPSLATLTAKLDELVERLDQPPQRFFRKKQAAAYCGISVDSIDKLLSGGKLTALRPVGGVVVVDRQQLDAFVSNSTAQPRKGRGRAR